MFTDKYSHIAVDICHETFYTHHRSEAERKAAKWLKEIVVLMVLRYICEIHFFFFFFFVSTCSVFSYTGVKVTVCKWMLSPLCYISCFSIAIFSAVRQSSVKCLLLYLYTSVGAYALLNYEQSPVSAPERPFRINISRLWYTQFISAL